MVELLLILGIIVSILLVLIILAQDSKGGAFAGFSGASQLMGVRRTTDLLEKLTWGFIGAIVVLVVTTSFVLKSGNDTGGTGTRLMEKAKAITPPPAPVQKTLPIQDSGAQPAQTADPAQPIEQAAPAGDAAAPAAAPADAAPAAAPAGK